MSECWWVVEYGAIVCAGQALTAYVIHIWEAK